ncbi:class I SAM-dependent methyltransferase [Pelagibius sp. CAU 1746]|uniref:class I SAM-dependent methyltransferase n=1 Tax=Pelagibius sp. CAU 1746 TaxID=3140370 RepID=UPI00325B9989
MTVKKMTPGDFTGLAKAYAVNRPNYSSSVLKSILGLVGKPQSEIDFVDVGAGTGIWTRMVAEAGVRSVVAVEPNEDMRSEGQSLTGDIDVRWLAGSAEDTTLEDNCCDLLTMASSFHWADFDKATKEFHSLLRPSGVFAALWNPRLIEVNPMLVEIESYLNELNPEIRRVSSGRSGITETLTEKLFECAYFDDVVYMEGRHVIEMTPERYLGAWRSVNDLQAQLGAEKFKDFLGRVEKRISGLDSIEATYLTRAWCARSTK